MESLVKSIRMEDRGSSGRWAVVLAGGDGTRLLPLTRKITGDDRPKQFCALTGKETLLDQTRRRVSRVVPGCQVLLVLTRTHERFYRDQMRDVPARNLLVQPQNQGTAPAIVYSLTRLNAAAPEAIVAFFPSDHHFANEEAFSTAVDQMFAHVELYGQHILLLGLAPESEEVGYGWIEPGARLHHISRGSVFKVRSFWEKPSRSTARDLMMRGCLWNTFVMVGRVSAFLEMIRRSLPDLLASFESTLAGTKPGEEASALNELFSSIPDSNFSDEVLSVRPTDLAVFPARGLGWTDLGEPERAISTLQLPLVRSVSTGKM